MTQVMEETIGDVWFRILGPLDQLTAIRNFIINLDNMKAGGKYHLAAYDKDRDNPFSEKNKTEIK